MARSFILFLSLLISFTTTWAQITITANDMPLPGDTLRYSSAGILNAMAYAADSGENMSWNYNLTPTSQGIDNYKKPSQVNPLYAFTIPNQSCYGYKIADSIPGIGFIAAGITISDLYTFYSKMNNPSCYAAEAFGATIAGFPVGSTYTIPDAVYMFPLNYNDNDSSDFHLKIGAPGLGGITQKGYRKTRVDGWGTITTPFITTPKACIRVRSEITEVDSISLDSLSFGIPRTTVEYKWLVNGEHYPALWVTTMSLGGFELVTGVKYRDIYRPELNTRVRNITLDDADVFAYPNPATDGWVRFEIPNSWTDELFITIYDMQGKLVESVVNKRQLDITLLPHGNYLARLSSGEATAYIKIVR